MNMPSSLLLKVKKVLNKMGIRSRSFIPKSITTSNKSINMAIALPTEVIVHLLRIILHQGELRTLRKFLKAFPLHAKLVLFITDQCNRWTYPFHSVSVFDYNPSSSSKFTCHIRVLAFYNLDRLITGSSSQVVSPRSAYGRFISKGTFIYVDSFQPSLSVRALEVKKLAKAIGAPKIIEDYTTLSRLSGQAFIDPSDKLTLVTGRQRGSCQTFDLNKPNLKLMESTSNWQFHGIVPITSLSSQSYPEVFLSLKLPNLTVANIHVKGGCNPSQDGTFCGPFQSALDAPNLKTLRISYESSVTPRIKLNSRKKLEVVVVNSHWDYSNPFGYRCQHAQEASYDQVQWCFRNDCQPKEWNPAAEVWSLRYIGVSDAYVASTNFEYVTFFHWERLCSTLGTDPAPNSTWLGVGAHDAKRLECLRVCSLVRDLDDEPESEIMPSFYAERLSSLTLVGLRGSDSPWDISRLLAGYLPPWLRRVHIANMTTGGDIAPFMSWNDLKFISPTVEELYIKGYELCYTEPMGDVCFHRLRQLWIDVTHAQICFLSAQEVELEDGVYSEMVLEDMNSSSSCDSELYPKRVMNSLVEMNDSSQSHTGIRNTQIQGGILTADTDEIMESESQCLILCFAEANFPSLESLHLHLSPAKSSWCFDSREEKLGFLDIYVGPRCMTLETSALLSCQTRVNLQSVLKRCAPAHDTLLMSDVYRSWTKEGDQFKYNGCFWDKSDDDQWSYKDYE